MGTSSGKLTSDLAGELMMGLTSTGDSGVNVELMTGVSGANEIESRESDAECVMSGVR